MSKTYTPGEYAEGLILHHGPTEGRAIALEMLRRAQNYGEGGSAFIVTIEDGADFQRVMARCVFLTRDAADAWGREKRTELRGLRIAEGEVDEAFVEAIDYHTLETALDA